MSLPPAAFTPGADEVFVREGCARASRLCLDADGLPLAGDDMPARIHAGASLEIKVLGCKASYADVTYEISSELGVSPDRLFNPEPDIPKQTSQCATAGDVSVLASWRGVVASAVDARTFRVIVDRLLPVDGAAGKKRDRSETYEARIDHGRYYLDFGILIPLVLGGDRQIVVEDTDQPELKRLQIRQDLKVFPALMLHVFPGGRDIGALNSFKVGRECVGPPTEWRRCRQDRHRRRVANALGLQIGVEADFKRIDRLFFGGLFEPISGLSVNVGLALTRLEYLRGGYYPGALIPAPTGTTDDGRPDVRPYIERHWAPRLYLGVTFSFDIIRTLGERRRSAAAQSVFGE